MNTTQESDWKSQIWCHRQSAEKAIILILPIINFCGKVGCPETHRGPMQSIKHQRLSLPVSKQSTHKSCIASEWTT